MTDEKIIELVKVIRDRTVTNNLNWEDTAVQNMYQATLTKFVIRIQQTPSNESQGELDYEISIINSDGVVLETIGDVDLSRVLQKQVVKTEINGYLMMAEIFNNAKRNALGVDKAIDEVIKELTALPPF